MADAKNESSSFSLNPLSIACVDRIALFFVYLIYRFSCCFPTFCVPSERREKRGFAIGERRGYYAVECGGGRGCAPDESVVPECKALTDNVFTRAPSDGCEAKIFISTLYLNLMANHPTNYSPKAIWIPLAVGQSPLCSLSVITPTHLVDSRWIISNVRFILLHALGSRCLEGETTSTGSRTQ